MMTVTWILQQDSVLAHGALSVRLLLVDHILTELSSVHTCQTWLPVAAADSQISSCYSKKHFFVIENVKAKATEVPNSLSKDDVQNCCECWQQHMLL